MNTKPQTTYTALRGLTNDETGKSYPVGATITEKDFPLTVLKAWAKSGKVKEQKHGDREN